MVLSLEILNTKGEILAASQGEDEINLIYTKEYEEGDRIKGLTIQLRIKHM